MTDTIDSPSAGTGSGNGRAQVLRITSLWNREPGHDKVYHVLSLQIPAIAAAAGSYLLWGLWGPRGKKLTLAPLGNFNFERQCDTAHSSIVEMRRNKKQYQPMRTTDSKMYAGDVLATLADNLWRVCQCTVSQLVPSGTFDVGTSSFVPGGWPDVRPASAATIQRRADRDRLPVRDIDREAPGQYVPAIEKTGALRTVTVPRSPRIEDPPVTVTEVSKEQWDKASALAAARAEREQTPWTRAAAATARADYARREAEVASQDVAEETARKKLKEDRRARASAAAAKAVATRRRRAEDKDRAEATAKAAPQPQATQGRGGRGLETTHVEAETSKRKARNL